MYFYKGTVFPITTEEFGEDIGKGHKEIVKASIEGITRNLTAGVSKKESCDCCVKGWGQPNEFGLCNCRCNNCPKSYSDCRYSCYNKNSKTYKKGCGEFHIDLNKSWE